MNDAAAILQAIRDGDLPAVQRLLTADPRLAHASDEHLKTPLHWAAERDRRDAAEILLDSGADLEATTSWGATALDWAATMGSAKVADLLLARGAKGMNLVVAASLGGVETLLTRPATTSHAGMSAEQRQQLGISDRLIRMSVGIEATDELVDDLAQALGSYQ